MQSACSHFSYSYNALSESREGEEREREKREVRRRECVYVNGGRFFSLTPMF